MEKYTKLGVVASFLKEPEIPEGYPWWEEKSQPVEGELIYLEIVAPPPPEMEQPPPKTKENEDVYSEYTIDI